MYEQFPEYPVILTTGPNACNVFSFGASSQSGASGVSGVHIPSCGNSSCQPFLQRVVNVLREYQVGCVEDYEYGGLYKDRFQQAFEQTRYTILHVCPELLSQTQRVEEVLKKDPFKAWFVCLQSHSSDDEDPLWFHQFHIKDLNTQEKIETFLGDLLARFGVDDASENTSVHQTLDDAEAGRDQQPSSPSYTPAKSAGSDDFQSVDVVLRPKTPSCPFINIAFFSLDPAQQSIIPRVKACISGIPEQLHAQTVGIKESEITLQRLITSFLIFGTTSFLQQRSVCVQMIKSLTKVTSNLDKRSQLSCSFLMTPLLFSMNKTVRQCVGYFLRQQMLYHEYMWDRLLLETIPFVWPMLLVSEIKLD